MTETTTVLAQRAFSALLFDMDGTVLTSIVATERVWGRWAEKHGLDVVSFLPTIHGMRAIDTVRRLALPGVDAEREAQDLFDAEMLDVSGIAPIDGALEFLSSLPRDRWAIVTSAPRALAEVRLAAAGIQLPTVLVTAEDVERGKPAPDCFQLAAEKLGVDARDCLVFEDAPAGISAGEAAGASVAVVTTTHTHDIDTAHPTIDSYRQLRATSDADGVWITEAIARVA